MAANSTKRLLDGLDGKLTTSKWASITEASQDTALRDNEDLTRRRILVREPGGGRSTNYALVTSPMDALRRVGSCTRQNARHFVSDGPRLPTPQEMEERQTAIVGVADEIEALASRSEQEPIRWGQFDELRTKLAAPGITAGLCGGVRDPTPCHRCDPGE